MQKPSGMPLECDLAYGTEVMTLLAGVPRVDLHGVAGSLSFWF
jgi:hypothetical protein